MSSITFMVPALNEQERIAGTLETVLAVTAAAGGLQAEVLVVDDGSTDATAAIVTAFAQEHPEVRLIRHETNRGLGQALRTALREARAEKFLIVPGDNDMPASVLSALLAQASAADMVMCYFPDRTKRGNGRHLLSSLFGLAYAVAFDVHVHYINGPCIYPVDRLRALELFSSRFSIVAEINVKLLRQGVSFLEIAGHRQTGLVGSTSLSLRNLREAIAVFARLCWEVRWRDRRLYRGRPRRVSPAPLGPDVPTA